MLVVFSDLHLTDESTARNVRREAFESVLQQKIIETAGSKKATELHLVLLGDIFDLVRTDWWLRNQTPFDDRPWNGQLNAATGMNRETVKIKTQFEKILAGVLENESSKALLNMLDNLRPQTGLPVKITYVTGNHDRVFNNFSSLKDQVNARLTNVQMSFQNAFKAPEYGVLARHGHEWDGACHGWEFFNKVLCPKHDQPLEQFSPEAYQVMALGEVITAELMSGIVFYMSAAMQQKGWNTPADLDFLARLKELNNLRPLVNAVFWLEWFTRNRYSNHKQKESEDMLLNAVRQAMKNVLDSTLAKQWDKTALDRIFWGDLVDVLQKIYAGLKLLKFDHLRSLISWWQSSKGTARSTDSADDLLVAGAQKEWEKLDRPFQYLVYGHTHQARQEYFQASPEGLVKMYINTGTFLPLIQVTRDNRTFATAHRMTMAFFFTKDEDRRGRIDNGPTLTLWNGIKHKMYV